MRDDAVLTLQRVLLAAEGLNAPPAHWMQAGAYTRPHFSST